MNTYDWTHPKIDPALSTVCPCDFLLHDLSRPVHFAAAESWISFEPFLFLLWNQSPETKLRWGACWDHLLTWRISEMNWTVSQMLNCEESFKNLPGFTAGGVQGDTAHRIISVSFHRKARRFDLENYWIWHSVYICYTYQQKFYQHRFVSQSASFTLPYKSGGNSRSDSISIWRTTPLYIVICAEIRQSFQAIVSPFHSNPSIRMLAPLAVHI